MNMRAGGESDGNDDDMEEQLRSIAEGLGFLDEGGEDDPNTLEGEAKVVKEPEGEKTPPVEKPAVEKPEGEKAAPEGEKPEAEKKEETEPAPRTWRPEAAALWASLPPLARAEIQKREQDMFAGIEAYKARASLGDLVTKTRGAYDAVYSSKGITPESQISALVQADNTLSFGTREQKVTLLRQIIENVGLDMDTLSAELPYEDPEVARLRRENEQIKSTYERQNQEALASRRQAFEAEVNAFASDPANKYFNELAADIQGLISSRTAQTLREAYDKALWMNPAVRERLLVEQREAAAAKDKEAAQARAEAARKAKSVNVKSTPRRGGAAATTGSMDDTLKETLAAIEARG